MNKTYVKEELLEALNFQNLALAADFYPPPPSQPMKEILGGLVTKLSEGTVMAKTLEFAFRRYMGEGKDEIQILINQCEKEITITKYNEDTAKDVVRNHQFHHVFKTSKRHFVKVKNYIKELKETEYDFLDSHKKALQDLKSKTKDICHELTSAINVPPCDYPESSDDREWSCSNGDDSGNFSCGEIETSSSDESDSESSDEEHQPQVLNRSDKHDRDFKNLYSCYLIFDIESNNYVLLKNAFDK